MQTARQSFSCLTYSIVSASAGEEFEQVRDEEIDAVSNLLQNLDLTTQVSPRNPTQYPEGMSAERFHYVTLRLLQQQSGNLFASLDAAFTHEWSTFEEADFTGPSVKNDCSTDSYK